MQQQASTNSTQLEDTQNRYAEEMESSGSELLAMHTVSEVDLQRQADTVCRVTAATGCESLQALLHQKFREAAPRWVQVNRAVMGRAPKGASMAR